MMSVLDKTPMQPSLLETLPGTCTSVLRLDRIDESGSGNKFFKLKYNLSRARALGYRRLASFGGAWSNHIHALAQAADCAGMGSVGIIRGEPGPDRNPMLVEAEEAGMELHFLTRAQYRRRHDSGFLAELTARFPDCYWLPEGGSNLQGVRGCMDIADYLDPRAEIVVVPCGTAATLAGLAAACPDRRVIGVSVLKGGFDLADSVNRHLEGLCDAGIIQSVPRNWSIAHGFHCGGYARVNRELVHFMEDFELRYGIALEPVYSGKMFYALNAWMESGKMNRSTALTAVHTGGMQGLRGMQSRINHFRRAAEPDRHCA